MKKFLRGIYIFIKGVSYARVASFHARRGDHDRALHIMKEFAKCK